MKNLNTFKLISYYETEKSEGVFNTPNVSFVAEDNSVRYLLENTIPGNFENGYEWVDLGLPSGLKWAACNVGADSPEKAGLYFAWGETVGYTAAQVIAGVKVFNGDTYRGGSSASISTDLTLEHDAAHVNMGGNWKMPTRAEFVELRNSYYTTWTWTADYNSTGVPGYVITSKTNGNSIFLPAAGRCGSKVYDVGSKGYLWSASWESSSYAWNINLNSGSVYDTHYGRYSGQSVRGVCE